MISLKYNCFEIFSFVIYAEKIRMFLVRARSFDHLNDLYVLKGVMYED